MMTAFIGRNCLFQVRCELCIHRRQLYGSFHTLLKHASLSSLRKNYNSQCRVLSKNLSMTMHKDMSSDISFERSRFQKVLRLFGKLDISERKLKLSGLLLYTKCVDGVNYEAFMNFCKLPDTFQSWFLLTELHVWMCMVRVMHEGDEGRVVRTGLVESFWKDMDARLAKLGEIPSRKKKENISILYQQFLASIFLYDEGLQSSDKVLAGALWRQLLQRQCNNPLILEGLVHYVRRQVQYLDSFTQYDVLIAGNVLWLPLPDVKQYDSLV